ncbi:MAG: DUF1501 domain-containing protein [Actinomycetota bacterium]|nr:DUF1501 domain-containing protein [Actinomycetota bacterium]
MPALSRRQFLAVSGVTAGAALAAGATTRPWTHLLHEARRNPLPTGTGVLVLVTLYGGNDGLNTLVPYADPAYHDARPELAYAEHEVLPLAEGLGLNPSMKGLKGLWDKGKLAVVRGVGYPDPDRSHFRSMAIWQTGSPGSPQPSGWLGRWLDATGTDPLRAVAVGPTLPPLLAGLTTAGAAVPVGPMALPTGRLGSALHDLETPYAGEPRLLARVAQSGADLFTVAATLGPALGTSAAPGTPEHGGGKPAKAGELAAQLGVVARCINAGAPTRVYSVSLGGFDTHADEKGTQSRLVGELDSALTEFLDAIGRGGHGEGVVVAAYSEFGRRVGANASQGTDHGTAAPMFVVGPHVKGGMYGEQPSLTSLNDGDLKFSTDFRAVYATLLERVLGTDAEQVLGKERFPRLDLLT